MEDLLSDREDALPDAPEKDDLQSVRTKFKLSEEALDIKERLSDYFDASQKDVCKIALDLTTSFLDGDDDLIERFSQKASDRPDDLRRKSHVVSRATLNSIEETAEELGLSRDQFLEGALHLVHRLIRYQRQRQIENHEDLLPMVKELRDKAEEVETEVREKTQETDPLRDGIGLIMVSLEQMIADLEDEIEGGEPLSQDHSWL